MSDDETQGPIIKDFVTRVSMTTTTESSTSELEVTSKQLASMKIRFRKLAYFTELVLSNDTCYES